MISEKTALMRKIQICDFALVEINEYLDTHPDCHEALACYREYLMMSKQLRTEYNMKFGPIVATDFDCDRTWAWVNDPWPWHNCSCEEE